MPGIVVNVGTGGIEGNVIPNVDGKLPTADAIVGFTVDVFFQPVVNAVPTLYFIFPILGGGIL